MQGTRRFYKREQTARKIIEIFRTRSQPQTARNELQKLRTRSKPPRNRLESPRRVEARGRERRGSDRTLRIRAITTRLGESLSRNKKALCGLSRCLLPSSKLDLLLLPPGSSEGPRRAQFNPFAAGGRAFFKTSGWQRVHKTTF